MPKITFDITPNEVCLIYNALHFTKAFSNSERFADLCNKFNVLWFKMKDEVAIDVLYPNAWTEIQNGCGDSSSRPQLSPLTQTGKDVRK